MLHTQYSFNSNGTDTRQLLLPGPSPAAAPQPPPPASGDNASFEPAWHNMPTHQVLHGLNTPADGLSEEEAGQRLRQVGPNLLPQAKPVSPVLQFLRQFRDVLVYVLLAAGLVTALMGEYKETIVILVVVLVNALIGFVQEGKAQAALASLRQLLTLEATVQRQGSLHQVPASTLVPGDIVYVDAGDRVPADLRVLSARNALTEEGLLTGESVPREKQVAPVTAEAALGDRTCMAYSGTLLIRGSLTGVVVATGSQTELGRIGQMVAAVETVTTPLLEKIGHFGKRLSVLILAGSALLFTYGWLFAGYTSHELFSLTVGLAVAAIPEGLPAILTITLALGVQRLARRKAIIRRLPAVETLGSVTVICTDKTGTLTKNEMTARKIVLANAHYSVTGTGYEPKGHVTQAGKEVDLWENPTLMELFEAGLLCSDAQIKHKCGEWTLEGDPTEGALVALAMKTGMDYRETNALFPRMDAIPFDSEHKFMATLHSFVDQENVIFLKGAPEVVLARCSFEQIKRRSYDTRGNRIQPIRLAYWERSALTLATSGYRVIAIARKPTALWSLPSEAAADGFTLLGLVGIIDPPRPETIEAISACLKAGIRVKMITGDHPATALAVGAQLGISNTVSVITGPVLDQMGDEELQETADRFDVFARTSPAHKLRLVEALQAKGEVVAMTGDGVNDAPALKRANVGIAMGNKGSEAAKEASVMVLTDDNFAAIRGAVAEGRTIYDNLRKAILFLLPTNGAQALMIILALIFALHALPVTPLQILWVNMVTAVTLSLALAFEPAEGNVMARPPRRPDEALIPGHLLFRMGFVSLLICAFSFGGFFLALDQGAHLAQAQTLAVNTLVMGQIFYLFNSRSLHRSAFSHKFLFQNRVAWASVGVLLLLQGLFTYLPLFHNWLGTAPLPAMGWLYVVLSGTLVFCLVEAEKGMERQLKSQRK
jgi:magnesium-transporting ATPase (P-type)